MKIQSNICRQTVNILNNKQCYINSDYIRNNFVSLIENGLQSLEMSLNYMKFSDFSIDYEECDKHNRDPLDPVTVVDFFYDLFDSININDGAVEPILESFILKLELMAFGRLPMADEWDDYASESSTVGDEFDDCDGSRQVMTEKLKALFVRISQLFSLMNDTFKSDVMVAFRVRFFMFNYPCYEAEFASDEDIDIDDQVYGASTVYKLIKQIIDDSKIIGGTLSSNASRIVDCTVSHVDVSGDKSKENCILAAVVFKNRPNLSKSIQGICVFLTFFG